MPHPRLPRTSVHMSPGEGTVLGILVIIGTGTCVYWLARAVGWLAGLILGAP